MRSFLQWVHPLRDCNGVQSGKYFLTLFIFIFLGPLFPVLGEEITALIREGDLLWKQRMEKRCLEDSLVIYRKALEIDPGNYEVNWRLSRLYYWLGDLLGDSESEEHKSLGESGMKYGKAAIKVNPSGIEGHYYYALTLGQYALGISILKALIMGLDSEYEKHLNLVLTMNRNYDYGGALRAMGRYYYRLPWPKQDLKRSIEYLKEATFIAPWCRRGHLYLAESYLKAGDREKAKIELIKAIKDEGNPEVEVDHARWQEIALKILKREFKEIRG